MHKHQHSTIDRQSIHCVDHGVRYQGEFEDTKGIIRTRKSQKDRQHTSFIIWTIQTQLNTTNNN